MILDDCVGPGADAVAEMESPAKRRKKNDSKPSPIPSRSLDFFFGKQATKREQPKLYGGNAKLESETIEGGLDSGEGLTDEELARKLQEQWAREEEQQQCSTTKDEERAHRAAATADVAHEQEEDVNHFLSAAPPPSSTQEKDDGHFKGNKNVLGLQSTASAEDTITLNIPFDQSPLTFDPCQYIPDLQKHWAADGGDASYALLTRCFILINSTQSRIKIVDTLVNCLRTLIEGHPDSLLPAVWLTTNSISPPSSILSLALVAQPSPRVSRRSAAWIVQALRLCTINMEMLGMSRLRQRNGRASHFASLSHFPSRVYINCW